MYSVFLIYLTTIDITVLNHCFKRCNKLHFLILEIIKILKVAIYSTNVLVQDIIGIYMLMKCLCQ